MSLRFRKSVKIIPGVRLNFNKNSTSLSFGVKGARMSINTKGDIYRSIGIPGTGIYDIERSSKRSRSGATRTRSSSSQSAPAEPVFEGHTPTDIKVGLFDPRFMKDFNRCVNPVTADSMRDYMNSYPDQTLTPNLFLATQLIKDPKTFPEGADLIAQSWAQRDAISTDPLFIKFAVGFDITMPLAPGIYLRSALSIKALALIYVEILQATEKFDDALKILENLEPDIHVQISTCEIETQLGKYDEVISSTEHIGGAGEEAAILYIFRAIAFREEGALDAAIETLKLAKTAGIEETALLNKYLFERGLTYEKQGKMALARKDYEKVMVTDSNYEGVHERFHAVNDGQG